MVCTDFLKRYTEYQDGLLAPEERVRFDEHLASCEGCKRYHTALVRGLAHCRELPRVGASPDFLPRLQHRLYHIDEAGKRRLRTHLDKVAMAAAAAALVAAIWLPLRGPDGNEAMLMPVAGDAPAAGTAVQPSLFDSGPFLPGRLLVPFAPEMQDEGGLFPSSYGKTMYEMTAATATDSAPSPVVRLTSQTDEAR